MPASDIIIKGAREHNLRDVDLVLPRNQLICLTGVSGSGKSSLAFDTLYAEGQRRYVESLSTFARQFLGQMPKPDVDHISGLSPSISISQKSSGKNPRSTVGTITEIYDFLRVLYARVGQGHCPSCGQPITAQSQEQIIARIMALPVKTAYSVLAPVVRQQKGQFRDLFHDLRKQGFIRARVDGQIVQLEAELSLDRQMRHDIEVVVDRLVARQSIRNRLAEAVELGLKIGAGNLVVAVEQGEGRQEQGTGLESKRAPTFQDPGKRRPRASDILLSADYACNPCGLSFQPPSPQLFSFNSPQGMCYECDGLGQMFSFDPEKLVTDPSRSLAQGCIELLGKWKDLGRWKRHIYKGVADTMEGKLGLDEGALLETPWNELTDGQQTFWLWGTGDTHITYTWRGGAHAQKHGGTFDGIIPSLLDKYRASKSKAQIAKLERHMDTIRCPDCQGLRLNPQARSVTLTSANQQATGAHSAESTETSRSDSPLKSQPNSQPNSQTGQLSLPAVCHLPISAAQAFFSDLVLDDTQQIIAAEVLKEIRGRLDFLTNVGLDYLQLDRTAPTLSGGETQRIRLAGQIGCGLVGVLYILDEPSIGLHPRDNQRLLATIQQLRDQGNTVVVVEHDEDTMRAADHLIDFGPGPGIRGGTVVATGTAEEIARKRKSVTGAYLSGKRKIAVPKKRREVRGVRNAKEARKTSNHSLLDPRSSILSIHGARHNNLRNMDVQIPLGLFVCVTGVSGSGKSSLVNGILVEALRRDLNGGKGMPGGHDKIEGLEHLDRMIAIDQSPIGRTPRSNPATYIKVLDDIRSLYAQLPESKRRGYKPGRFSFNVVGGRCEACSGNGSNKLEMDFLADVWVTCPVCQGHRFNHETLQVKFKHKSIAEVLEMDIQQALDHFENIPAIQHKLATLHAVGLDYMKLGQPSPTLSGGEAQRIKLARELVKKSTGRTLYLLDEPTTGLHFADVELLLQVLHNFVDAGNTVLVIEHNLDVVKTADWVIDIGPEGGKEGGQVVASGSPEEIVTRWQAARNIPGERAERGRSSAISHTAAALAPYLGLESRAGAVPKKRKTSRGVKQATHIIVRGARQHNLRNVDAKIARDQMTVCCGVSGSGKSSLATDTIYAEGQRRYVESLSSYARQFIGQMQKPKIEHIEGLSPAIAIEQRTGGHTPRSTVGTVTEIYDYLRILFSRLGQMHCPECDTPIGTQSADEIIDTLLLEPAGTRLYLLAPVDLAAGNTYEDLWQSFRSAGYVRTRLDGTTYQLDAMPSVDRRRKHDVEILVDRVTIRPENRARLADSIENALALGRGVLHTAHVDPQRPEPEWQVKIHSQHLVCSACQRSFEPLSPHHFSFNSVLGWCPACEGLGTELGANPAALFRDMQLTLAEGAVLLWPTVEQPMFAAMLQALSEQTGLPTDMPYDRLSPRQRRQVLYGTGGQWIQVGARHEERGVRRETRDASQRSKKPNGSAYSFRFQYKGLYPALEAAARVSPRLRGRLEHLVDQIECSQCGGSRLRDDAAATRFEGQTIHDICRLPLGSLLKRIKRWKLTAPQRKMAGELVKEIGNRLTFLVDVGLDYLTIGRSAPTLSGGESQRIRLASQVGSGLCGVLYVLDEPTIGLHPRDNRRLISALHKLRDLGNTLLVVEHDRDVVASADGLLDFGPAAGRLGGEIVARGTPKELAKRRKSVTGPYLSGTKAIGVPENRRQVRGARGEKSGGTPNNSFLAPRSSLLSVLGARHNNLKNIDVHFPLATLIAVTGVSGSGKSSLVNGVLYNQLAHTLHRAHSTPGAHDKIVGIQHIDKVIRVDQRPLGNTPTSNPATYSGLFDLVRQLFAQLPDARLRGYTARRFSFNVTGGRCDACDGAGQRCIEMHFLPDVWVPCDTCGGKRYNPQTLEVRYRGHSIADVLELTCGEAAGLFKNIPKIRHILQTLCDVGLDYVALGQSAATLSGGEAQRVKLAAELARPDTGKTLYLLDEPTTGLHFSDIEKLLDVLHRLVDLGNTVVIIEHNLDVIKQADWILDLGPEAGAEGGEVVAAGTPEAIVKKKVSDTFSGTYSGNGEGGKKKRGAPISHTAVALAPVLAAGPPIRRQRFDFAAAAASRAGDLSMEQLGADIPMPWEADGRRWHTRDRVSRNGEKCHWDGNILEHLERRIHEQGQFGPTQWNTRTVVEISGLKKSDGWFFHAITGEPWLIKLKFRTAKKTFQRDALMASLALKPLNDIPEVEAYGRGPRVKCKNLRGPWQEVQIHAHHWNELDTPAFQTFLEQAIAGFQQFSARLQQQPEDVMPWKVLGRKWHLARKGFPPGKRPAWPAELLEELLEQLRELCSEGQFLWNNQQVVHLLVRQQREPWATVYTKRLAGVDLLLHGPHGALATGRIANLGRQRAIVHGQGLLDQVKLRFVALEDLERGDLVDFLGEHLDLVRGAGARG